MSTIDTWAAMHKIHPAALADLRAMLTQTPAIRGDIVTEAGALSVVRRDAAQQGTHLWRNNVGAGTLENGNYVRWGLANESPKTNQIMKSSDLIGLRPVVIGLHHVGGTIAQFVAREVKAPGWVFTGTAREVAQLNFLELVTANGGDAKFTTGAL